MTFPKNKNAIRNHNMLRHFQFLFLGALTNFSCSVFVYVCISETDFGNRMGGCCHLQDSAVGVSQKKPHQTAMLATHIATCRVQPSLS